MNDIQACEFCSKEYPIEDCMSMEDSWICQPCYAAWKAEFDACNHEWEPHMDSMGDAGQYCTRCSGFVSDEDMPAMFPAPEKQP